MGGFPYLGEAGSALAQVMLVAAAGVLINQFMDRRSPWQRGLVFSVAIALALRYAWWRATETLAPPGLTFSFAASVFLLSLELLSMAGSVSAFLLLTRYRDRSREATEHLGWWEPGPPPRISLMIATYNEELEVLERTIVGAKSLRYPNKQVVVLDDGRRDWLRDYCEKQGVRYLRRADNKGSKAGNINNGLRVLAADPEPSEFIAVLDADFVPHRGFLSRSLALFHDPRVGLVQTPQHFFNADPIQHNLGLDRSYPDEQRFFFDHMQPARDAWGIAICCGTSSVIRRAALDELGGFPTDSVTEDFLLTLALQEKGWKSVYLNEALTEGLAPEGLKEYVTQRARWCLGLMQIARGPLGPFARNGLRIRDRWSVIDTTFYWLTSFVFRLAGLLFPLLYWYFNVTVVNASVADVIRFFGTYFLWVSIAMNTISGGLIIPLAHDVSQIVGAIPITRAAFTGILRPKGHAFKVTAKGGDRSKVQVQWRMMMPFLITLGLTVVGLFLGSISDRFAFYDAGDGKAVVLFWTFYNIFLLALTCLVCVELPRQERHIADEPELAPMLLDGRKLKLWLTSVTRDTATVRGHQFAIGTRGRLQLRDVGDVDCVVIGQREDGAILHLNPNDEQHEALYLRFYTEDNAPGITTVKLGRVLADLGSRLTTRPGL
ncbi:glycosyltransferase [Frigidibacter sp. MR17.14]|uniref:glycosyltransferase family 2 protein n=1 Tax=Frigidibacter sp. MR17.14 TaxID=3126509 RepID=UPI003012A72A